MEALANEYSVKTNYIYFVTAIIQILFGNFLLALALIILGISSYKFHYHTAAYNKYAADFDMRIKMHKKMKFWQRMDVASIYLTFGVYPFELTGNYWWLLFMIPMGILILNKLNIIFKTWNSNSQVWVPIAGSILSYIAYTTIPLAYFIVGIVLITIATIFQILGIKSLNKNDYIGYDIYHGHWHIYGSIAFMLIH